MIERLEDPRFLAAPGERPSLLSIEQSLVVCQALGLSLKMASGAVTVQAVGDHVLLQTGDGPVIKTRAEWRTAIDRWTSQAIIPRWE